MEQTQKENLSLNASLSNASLTSSSEETSNDEIVSMFNRTAWNRAKRNRPSGLPIMEGKTALIKSYTHHFVEPINDAVTCACMYHRSETDYYGFEEALCHYLLNCCVDSEVAVNLIGIHFNDREAERKLPDLEKLYNSLKFSLTPNLEYSCKFQEIAFSVKLEILELLKTSGSTKGFFKLSFHLEQAVSLSWFEALLTAAYNFSYPQVGGYNRNRRKRHTLNVLTNDNGYWTESYQVPKRAFDSIFLDTKVKNRLKSLLEKKFDFEWYQKKGLSAKLSLLLHGKPGTGKTSLIRSIASELECDIHILNLNSVKDDSEFNKLIRHFTREKFDDSSDDSNSDSDEDQPKKSTTLEKNRDINLLIIEDIDCIFQNRKNKEGGFSSVTLSTLLNMLDGFMTVDNLIIIVTTNFPDKLDEALKRPGRIDFNIEMKYPTTEHIINCYRWIYSLDEASLSDKAEKKDEGDISGEEKGSEEKSSEEKDEKEEKEKELLDQTERLRSHFEANKTKYLNISLGLYQQYFVYCYKNELDVMEHLKDLKQMVDDFRDISPDKDTPPNGLYT